MSTELFDMERYLTIPESTYASEYVDEKPNKTVIFSLKMYLK